MILRVMAMLFLLARPALAAPVQVTSGEHDGFTRVVLNFGAALDWQFGRLADGYRFRPIDVQADYDLRAVFQRIGTSRLAAISANAETFELDIGFACACHAIPFEFRPGIIVIDLRDGPPPKGSSFEAALLPALDKADIAAPKPFSGYDWQKSNLVLPLRQMNKAELAPKPTTTPNLQPLRDQLMRQLSRGVTEGVIELEMPQSPTALPKKANLDAARVALGELGGVQLKAENAPQQVLAADGKACTPTERLNIYEWGDGADTSSILAQDMTNLVGEFDRPEAEFVTRAVKARLYLGFGLEARQIMSAFPSIADDEPVLTALSYIIDGEHDPSGAFQGQEDCSSAASMWAILTSTTTATYSDASAKAVIQAFSALPSHLRMHLAPKLIDHYIATDNQSIVTSLRNILVRAGSEAGPQTSLTEAKIELSQGQPKAAEERLQSAGNGVNWATAETAITQVKARIDQGLPVEKETVDLLISIEGEFAQTSWAPKIAAAKLHALAASGDFEAAFEQLPSLPDETSTLWRLLANLGTDSDLLTFAVSAPQDQASSALPENAKAIAKRLLDLGLPDPALEWSEASGIEDAALLGSIHIARKDARAALAALGTDESDLAKTMRAKAYWILGDHKSAANQYQTSDNAYSLALAKAQNWQGLAEGQASAWQELAKEVSQPLPKSKAQIDTFGPLAQGLALTQESAETRNQINRLLQASALANP